ncbi:hypothetical protein F1643_18205 [Azospirillum sp. INR13]|uniref:hypothetical protein n=1 Tax=Azospirillum sp. INR13 TaxID=2596919 RepID=UPI00189211C3|nr:hypothetical protein [Azospirillum sp. INR13]MBF5096024.1 hypothetical protein [Azospirillum sp. INR13]
MAPSGLKLINSAPSVADHPGTDARGKALASLPRVTVPVGVGIGEDGRVPGSTCAAARYMPLTPSP